MELKDMQELLATILIARHDACRRICQLRNKSGNKNELEDWRSLNSKLIAAESILSREIRNHFD